MGVLVRSVWVVIAVAAAAAGQCGQCWWRKARDPGPIQSFSRSSLPTPDSPEIITRNPDSAEARAAVYRAALDGVAFVLCLCPGVSLSGAVAAEGEGPVLSCCTALTLLSRGLPGLVRLSAFSTPLCLVTDSEFEADFLG